MGALRLISLQEEAPLVAYSRVVTEVARRLSPSVANLRVSRRVGRGRRLDGGGSGVVITPDGFVLTSAHVVEGTNRGVASFVDGRELTVEVVGSDPLSDLAVLRTESNGLTAAELGDAETLQVGQLVVAIGNPNGFAGSLMTEGRFRRAYIGIAGGSRPLPPRLAASLGRHSGIEVVQVVDGSPADRAGLRAEDLIVEVDGSPVSGVDDLQRLMAGELIGRGVTTRLLRQGKRLDV